jgi:uncharacterized protein (DUF4415 family)
MLKFDWDPRKDKANQKKHGVSFEEAQSVFFDDSANITAGENMKSEYDLSKMNSRKNPYASKLKKQVTIRMGQDVICYFKAMSEDTGIPYQSLINLYLKDCVSNHRKINLTWEKQA